MSRSMNDVITSTIRRSMDDLMLTYGSIDYFSIYGIICILRGNV
jgi:hypothetical protein